MDVVLVLKSAVVASLETDCGEGLGAEQPCGTTKLLPFSNSVPCVRLYAGLDRGVHLTLVPRCNVN